MSLNTLLLFWQQPFCLFYTNALGSIKFRFSLFVFLLSFTFWGCSLTLEQFWKEVENEKEKEEERRKQVIINKTQVFTLLLTFSHSLISN